MTTWDIFINMHYFANWHGQECPLLVLSDYMALRGSRSNNFWHRLISLSESNQFWQQWFSLVSARAFLLAYDVVISSILSHVGVMYLFTPEFYSEMKSFKFCTVIICFGNAFSYLRLKSKGCIFCAAGPNYLTKYITLQRHCVWV